MNRNRLATGLAACLAAALAAGCVKFPNLEIGLPYSQNVQGVEGAGAVDVAPRPEPSVPRNPYGQFIIGRQRNAYGSQAADVVTRESVTAWVCRALKIELRMAGYRPRVCEKIPDSCARGVEAEVVTMLGDMRVGFTKVYAYADVTIRLRFIKDGRQVREELFSGHGESRRLPMAPPATREEAFDAALQECLRRAVPLIAETFGKNPS
jgi:hypothetical protein